MKVEIIWYKDALAKKEQESLSHTLDLIACLWTPESEIKTNFLVGFSIIRSQI